MSTSVEDVFALIESRLSRIEHVIKGTNTSEALAAEAVGTEVPPLVSRLESLEKRLSVLSRDNAVIANLLSLCSVDAELKSIRSGEEKESTLSSSDISTIVLASSATFQSAQAKLSSLDGMKLENATDLVPMAAMLPEIASVMAVHEAQENEITELQQRSVRLLAKWYSDSVLDRNGRWADWEDRLLDVERVVRRREIALEKEGQ